MPDDPVGAPRSPTNPFGRLLGLRRLELDDGRATYRLTVRPELLNPHGVLHGGVAFALADTAMGAALHTRLAPGERGTTVEIKIQYIRPVAAGDLVAEARLVERTRRLGILEARVRDPGGRVVALATGTFAIQGPRAPLEVPDDPGGGDPGAGFPGAPRAG
jgi:acyl-CoA thioesterase